MVRTSEYPTANFYTDESLANEPYPYYEWIREQGNVWRAPYEDVVVVVGYDELWEVDRDPETFSSANSTTGPVSGAAVHPRGR